MAAESLAMQPAGFLPEAWTILSGMEEALQGLASPEAAAAEHLLQVLTHRMAGSAAQFGLDAVARVADAMEEASRRLPGGADRAADLQLLREGLSRLGELLATAQAPAPPAEPFFADLADFARREPEVVEYFLPEMRELLEEAEEGLLGLAREDALGPAEKAEAVTTVFRRVHTLKGAAFVVGCQSVGTLAHQIEDALVVGRADPARFDADGARTALDALDVLRGMAEVLAGRPEAADLPARLAAVRSRLGRWMVAASAAETPAPVLPAPKPEAAPAAAPPPDERRGAPGLRLQLRAVDGLVQLTGELLAVRNRLRREIERAELLREERQASIDRLRRTLREFSGRHLDPLRPGSAAAEKGADEPEDASGEPVGELDLERYDDFNVLARRLDEISADLAEEESQEAELSRQLASGSEDLRRLVDELHSGVGRLRLVPIGQIFGRAARLVRRSAAAAGREISLEAVGERVEVDAAIAEQIWEPLMHLVQNALDHGLEPADERVAAGKPAAGRLRLRAAAEGRRVVVEVEDDGAGIAEEKVRARAAELGFAEPAGLDERGVLDLIFRPGFTRLQTATESAGRGIGLDVVRSTLERLGGSAEVVSVPGEGTRFRLAFPFTLVVSEALLVRVGDAVVALPATAVERIVEADPASGAAPLEPGGSPIPPADLARVLGVAAHRGAGRTPAAVVGSPGRWRALLVDEVLGSETAVLRPLGPFFARFDLFSGALLTREGRLVLLLNPQAALAAGAAPLPLARTRPAPTARERPFRIVLADDSVSVRKALGGILTRAGFEVALAADGEEAAVLLEGGPFDLLITDLEMPRRNGYELIAWLRRQPATARLPALVVTTRVGERHQELAFQVGATSCLSKPVGEDLLLRTAADLAARGRRSHA